jgi:hypothetical protein
MKRWIFNRFFKSEVKRLIDAAYENSLIDSYAMHFMFGFLDTQVEDNPDPYVYFQNAKRREPRK